jgi:thiamine-monophosphate kinase
MAGDRPHEFELIKRFFAPLATDAGSLGLADDAAVFSPRSGYDLVLTKDMLAADVHFFAGDPPEAIARKALRVNLSDLAAKGARPRGYLLGLGLAVDWTADWLERFCAALKADQAAYSVVLWGGDTIKSGDGLQISVTAIGEVPQEKAVRRNGARAGDALYASGTIGDGAAGLKARLDSGFAGRYGLNDDDLDHILDRYLLPRPRVELAGVLSDHAKAAMDVSDGLFADAKHIAEASAVDLRIDLDLVPVSLALGKIRETSPEKFTGLLGGGDDYEILACVPSASAAAFEEDARAAGCPVTRIGDVTNGNGQVELHRGGLPVRSPSAGFQHF